VSLIDDRYVCDECGGYRVGFKTGLSSACTCPDYAPVEPARHQIGAPVIPVPTPVGLRTTFTRGD
jgi:hypothetical protein